MAGVVRRAWVSSEEYLDDEHTVVLKYVCGRLADAKTEFRPVMYSTCCRTQPTKWGIRLSYFKSPDEYDDTFRFSIRLKRADSTSNRVTALFSVGFVDEYNSPIFRRINGNKEWMASGEETEDFLPNILPIKLNEIEGVSVTLVIRKCHEKDERASVSTYGMGENLSYFKYLRKQTLRGESAIAFKYCTDRESASGSKDCTGGYSATGSKDCTGGYSGYSATGSKDFSSGNSASGSKDGSDGESASGSKDDTDGESAVGCKDCTDSGSKDGTNEKPATESKDGTEGNSEHLEKFAK